MSASADEPSAVSPAGLPWIERRWTFAFPVETYPSIVERLRGTPARVDELVRGLDATTLRRRDGERWSIQEHVGHLYDLEALPRARLDDLLAGERTLTAADMTNRATHEARHDEREIGELCDAFREARMRLVSRLDALAPNDFARTSLHPRLETPMRLVDMLVFQADHDDHHLARASELRRRFEAS